MSNYIDLQRLWAPAGSKNKGKAASASNNKNKKTATLLNHKLKPYGAGEARADQSLIPIINYVNNRSLRLEFFSIASNESAKFVPMDIEYSESFTSEWNHVSVYGRNDPMSTFQGTKRNIKLAFIVNGNSPDNARSNMIELSNLTSLLYPTYFEDYIGRQDVISERDFGNKGNATTIEAAPLLRVHLNNLIVDPIGGSTAGVNSLAKSVGLVCSSSGFEITPDLDKGVFITSPGGITKDLPGAGFAKGSKPIAGSRVYPKVYKVSTTLTVFHTFPLGFRRDPGEDDTNSYARSENGFGNFPWGEKHVYSKKEALAMAKKSK